MIAPLITSSVRKSPRLMILALALFALAACAGLPDNPPPLISMEEPLPLTQEPDDEAERLAAAKGSFTGLYVSEGKRTLEEMVEGGQGVSVVKVVENSPADIAGIRVDDLLLAAGPPAGEEVELKFSSLWRKLELETAPGAELLIVFDRAGVESEVTLRTVPRVSHPDRHEVERFRDEDKVGVVVRTATEVEARRYGLGPGAGAVVVGLAKESPWRQAGIRFGDVILRVKGEVLAHPSMLIEAIRATGKNDRLKVEVARGEERQTVELPVSSRRQQVRKTSVFPLFDYEADTDGSETSVLFGLFGHKSTKAAWETTILWFIKFGGGDSDELEEVEQ